MGTEGPDEHDPLRTDFEQDPEAGSTAHPPDIKISTIPAEASDLGTCADGPTEPPQDLSEEIPPLALVLLGRIGVGKSSTGNTLLGKDSPECEHFAARRAANSVTKECTSVEKSFSEEILTSIHTKREGEQNSVDFQKLVILDTPGLGASSVDEIDALREIHRGISELLPSSSAVCLLLVFSLAVRIGEDELKCITTLRDHIFGLGMLGCSMVVWTHGDLLDDESQLQDYLQDLDPRLREILDAVGAGSVVINNKSMDSSLQMQKLLTKAMQVATSPCPTQRPGAGAQRVAGRKSARRQRQMENGLLKRDIGGVDDRPMCEIM